ncbi:MAG: hypothetical protein SGI77_19635 [Pirellulaceae bacterium]|nr:hypothetical protein [Pirellulaceae bacterium]
MIQPTPKDYGKLADAAAEVAAQDVLDAALKAETSIVTWEDGRIVELDPTKVDLKARIERARSMRSESE